MILFKQKKQKQMRKILEEQNSSIEALVLTFCNTFFQLSVENITIFSNNGTLKSVGNDSKEDERNDDLRCIDQDHSCLIVNSLLDFEKQVDKPPAFHDLGTRIHSTRKILNYEFEICDVCDYHWR